MSNYFRCACCLTVPGAPDWNAYSTVLWANGHGIEKRIFCRVCGAWTDVKLLYATDETLTAVVKQGDHLKALAVLRVNRGE